MLISWIGGLFGNNQNKPASGGLFGNNTSTSNTGGGLFGNTNTNNQSKPGGLFGNTNTFGNTTTSSSGIFNSINLIWVYHTV